MPWLTSRRPTPDEALQRLMDGNARYVADEFDHLSRITSSRREELKAGQEPFASVLTCADSRVAPEHIFDVGLGEIFVCRNAGNLADDAVLGSIEYAVAHMGCPLLVVLGHSRCGAVKATLQVAKSPEAQGATPYVDAIVRRILLSVLATREGSTDDAGWADLAARKHVLSVCRQISDRSSFLAERIRNGQFKVMGGFYHIGTGKVELLLA